MSRRALPLAKVLESVAGLDSMAGQDAMAELIPHSSQPRLGEGLIPSAVLVPLLEGDGDCELLFMRRSMELPDHPGQVSFPGGTADPEDSDLLQTALRESREEVGVEHTAVRVLGALPLQQTLRKFSIQPYLCIWPEADYAPVSLGEVDRVFRVPLSWLLDPATDGRALVTHEGMEFDMPAWVWDGEIIWGATRRITLDLLRHLSSRGI